MQPSAYPTQLYASATQPVDTARAAEYGAVGEIPGAMFEQFNTMFSGPDAPNPHDVAEAVAKLIVTPNGDRPVRTVVGASFGADTLNDATAPVQAGVVKALGLLSPVIFRRFSVDYPMHPELKVGNKFPDFELPDQTGTLRKLSQLLRGFPGVLLFGRGYY